MVYSTSAEFSSGEGSHMFNISGQNVNFVQGGPKTGTLFVCLIFIRLNFIKYLQISKLISLSKSEELL